MTAAAGTPRMDRFKVAAGLLVLAAAGHALAIPHHADPGHGGASHVAAFTAVTAAQLLGAVAVARSPVACRRRAVVLIGSAVLIALWAVSRTVGLPYGPHPGESEAVGLLDALTVAAQLGVVGLLARTSRPLRLPVAFAASFAVVIVGMATLDGAGLAPPAGATSHHHEQPDGGHDQNQRPLGAPFAEPAAATSHDDYERADVEHGHSHDGIADQPHP